ncbi:MAG TPA: hypothetical protein VI588_00580 [Candidatus Gracilibacteria bacterium]|nr:hypothetical protein [Candidatus Gracilibacteria bacterium]
MHKRNIFSGALVTVMAMSMLAGCQNAPAPQKAPEEVLKEGMAKLQEVKAYKFEVAMKGDVKDELGKAVNFDFVLGGAADSIDAKDPKVSLKLDGSMSDGTSGAGGNASAELRLNKENVYFNVMKLDLKGEGAPPLPEELTSLFGKWYVVPLPPEVQAEMAAGMEEGNAATMTPEMAAMTKAWEDSKVLAAPQYVGTENIMGESSYHYSVTVDKAALAQFLKKVAESQGEAVTDDDVTQLEEGLKAVDLKGDVWVGTQSGVMNQVIVSVNMKASDASDGASGNFMVRFTAGDINKPVTLQIPPAEPFPTDALMGLMGAGAMMDPSALDPSMMDPSLIDPSMMDDSSMMLVDPSEGVVGDLSSDMIDTGAPVE